MPDKLLRKLLLRIEPKPGLRLIVVEPDVLSLLESGQGDKELVVKVDCNVLITCFYCCYAEYKNSCKDYNILYLSLD